MFALLLFIIFPILYFSKNRTWYFIYALLFFLIGRFIAYKTGLSYAMIIHNVFFIGILLPFMGDRVYEKYYKIVFLWAIIYVFYLYCLHLLHGSLFYDDLKLNFKTLFVFIFAVEVFENIKNNKIDLVYFVKFFEVILLFEIVLCWLQFLFHDFGNFFRITELTWNGEVKSVSGSSADVLDNNLCLGTLMKASSFANFLTVSIVSLFLAKQKAGIRRKEYILLALCVSTLLITGIRAPFLILLLMLFFVLLKGKRNIYKFTYLVVGLIVFFFLFPILSNIGGQGNLNSFDNSVLRSLSVFTQLESGSFSEESTFTWPLSMIPYIIEHPLLGNGLHYSSGYFMALNLHVLEDLSISDAGIFFYWAEYGLIGILIFYYFFFFIVKISPAYGFVKSDLRFLVIMLFLLSIVDCSVSNDYCTTVFALAPIMLKYYQEIVAERESVKALKTKEDF